MKASLVIDANIRLKESKSDYETELNNAKKLYPGDERITEVETNMKEFFEANKWMDTESNLQDDCVECDNISSQEDDFDIDAVKSDDLPPDHDDHLDIIAWLKSPEGMLEIEKDYDEQFVPSFSLGISQICQEVMEEHGADAENIEWDDSITPLPLKEHEKRTKRDVKVGPAYRSPYVQRNIDVNSSYSKEEIAVYRWILQDDKDQE